MGLIEHKFEDNFITTNIDRVLNWARESSIWPMGFGLACCAIEMMAASASRYDIARFGAEAFRASPRQADMMILSGRVSVKMAPVIRRVYDQILEPKWVIAMGACSSSGGMFANYAVVQGADKFMPVDVHIPGCPPRPEALLHGFNKLQRLVRGQPDLGWRQRYNAVGTEEWARLEGGEPTPEALERAALAVAPKHSETAPRPATPGREAEDVAEW
jgi:NADH-quinone oxidoreductase subunit B